MTQWQLFICAGAIAIAGCSHDLSQSISPNSVSNLMQTTEGNPLQGMSEAIKKSQYRDIEAVFVERFGRVFHEEYFGDTTAETLIDARSVGKSITAIALGIAIDEGAVDGVNVPVLDFFQDREPIRYDGDEKRSILLADLLTMSSTLDCDDWRSNSPGNELQMYRSIDWTRFALDIPIDPQFTRGRYSYCTAGAFLLGRVVERATGQPFDEYVQSRLFDPLGIYGAVWTRAPNGEVQSGGQLALRARDFAAIGKLVLNDGRLGEKEIVSPAWVNEMLRPRTTATSRDRYGYLWWIRSFKNYTGFYMSGNGGNKVVVFPVFDAVVVILSTRYNHADMHVQTTRLLERYIVPALREDGEAM